MSTNAMAIPAGNGGTETGEYFLYDLKMCQRYAQGNDSWRRKSFFLFVESKLRCCGSRLPPWTAFQTIAKIEFLADYH